MNTKSILTVFGIILLVQTGEAIRCVICNYLKVRYDGFSEIEGMDLSSMLPDIGGNDTKCYYGVASQYLECEPDHCGAIELILTAETVFPGTNSTITATMTYIQRGCAAGVIGCDSQLTPNTEINLGGQRTTIQDIFHKSVPFLGAVRFQPNIVGKMCACAGLDFCNNDISTVPLEQEAPVETPNTYPVLSADHDVPVETPSTYAPVNETSRFRGDVIINHSFVTITDDDVTTPELRQEMTSPATTSPDSANDGSSGQGRSMAISPVTIFILFCLVIYLHHT